MACVWVHALLGKRRPEPLVRHLDNDLRRTQAAIHLPSHTIIQT